MLRLIAVHVKHILMVEELLYSMENVNQAICAHGVVKGEPHTRALIIILVLFILLINYYIIIIIRPFVRISVWEYKSQANMRLNALWREKKRFWCSKGKSQ